ncbi:hypothetical protein ON010_g15339 [Phytophthora cinnamomi]|nr:hypothetical protein ON010_g15339 [Phytophthora cinnamomi]
MIHGFSCSHLIHSNWKEKSAPEHGIVQKKIDQYWHAEKIELTEMHNPEGEREEYPQHQGSQNERYLRLQHEGQLEERVEATISLHNGCENDK